MSTDGILRVHPTNPRYFTLDGETAIFAGGSHTWATIQERKRAGTPDFDFPGWIDFLGDHGHNFLRLWVWEQATWMQFSHEPIEYRPTIFERSGGGVALDGGPRFDLTKVNPEFLQRLVDRVEYAVSHGILVSVMLFQGFSLYKEEGRTETPIAFQGGPYHRDNNVNGIDGDLDGTGRGEWVHTLRSPAITKVQEEYVRAVVTALNHVHELTWEIANEANPLSVAWQQHMIDFVRDVEAGLPHQHLVGFTGNPVTDDELMSSSADWISPMTEPYGSLDFYTETTGEKVSLLDTDHTNFHNAHLDPSGPWRAMLRGHNYLLMDFYRDARLGHPTDPWPEQEELRRQVGSAVRLSQRIPLARMVPRGELASSGYCLAAAGEAYLVLARGLGGIGLDLREAAPAQLHLAWIGPDGTEHADGVVSTGERVWLENPFDSYAIAYLHA